MLHLAKPQQSEYQQIADLVNNANQIYQTLFSPEELKKRWYTQETAQDLLEWEKTRTYLCAYNQQWNIVGYASYRLKNPQTLWISMIQIDPLEQKKGIGTQLLKAIEQEAKKMKALVVVLETDEEATRATNFYLKNDYQILSDKDLLVFPFDKVLEKKQVIGRYIFGKKL